MKTENLNKEELQNLLFKSKVIGQGTYGLIVEYDDNTLLKIYYKDIFETYNSRNIDKIDKDIENYNLAIPTTEHFIPFLNVLGLLSPSDKPIIFNEDGELGSITMTSFIFEDLN